MSESSQQPFSLIIATFERPDDLRITLDGVLAQKRRPEEIIVVDSSRDDRTKTLCAEWSGEIPLRYQFSNSRSAAKQRNEGADLASPASTVLGFMDDDITLYPETCEKVLSVFDRDADGKTGGISVRIDDIHRPIPSGITRAYLKIQAGYDHPTYGARLFGAGINCLPTYEEQTEDNGTLIRADWLNSGCVFYRREPFLRERFPAFDGYSFMEDVHCSARIGKTHRLYFHKTATCGHREGTNSLKRDYLGIARMRIRNQRIVATEVQGLRGFELGWKFLLHRLFSTIAILRGRETGWQQSLKGTWM
jgi:glycosyltransferase involved in cell wall biosynthesis